MVDGVYDAPGVETDHSNEKPWGCNVDVHGGFEVEFNPETTSATKCGIDEGRLVCANHS